VIFELNSTVFGEGLDSNIWNTAFYTRKKKILVQKGEKNKTQIGVWFFLVRPKKIRL